MIEAFRKKIEERFAYLVANDVVVASFVKDGKYSGLTELETLKACINFMAERESHRQHEELHRAFAAVPKEQGRWRR